MIAIHTKVIYHTGMRSNIIFHASQLLRKVGFGFDAQSNPAVLAMEKKIRELGSIEFKTEFYPDGSWVAESTNLDGIITGGTDTGDMSALMKDAIFTYFNIPPHLSDDALLRANNEPVTVNQRVWAIR